MLVECCLCRIMYLDTGNMKSVCKNKVTKSGKTILAVILHVSKVTKTEVDVPKNALVCGNCFKDLALYDECVVNLLMVQQRLTQLIEEGQKKDCETTNVVEDVESADPMDEEEISIADLESEPDEVDEQIEAPPSEDNLVETNPLLTCEQCQKAFKNKTHLRQHMKQEHPRKNSVTCAECGKKVRNEDYLDLHMNIHMGKTEMECRFCSRRFRRKVNVVQHMQRHVNRKRFQCEKCGLQFSQTTVLYNHKLQHQAEEAPLICSICKQSFKTIRTYKRHIITHSEDRPRFMCQYCPKTFLEKYTLKVHLRVHENASDEFIQNTEANSTSLLGQEDAKPIYLCIICGCNFISKEQYNQHMENEHDVILTKD